MRREPGSATVANMKIKESASLLTFGVIVLVIGQAIFSAAQASYASAQLASTYSDPSPAGVVVGALISLVGLILLVVGVYRLGVNVDYAARQAAQRD